MLVPENMEIERRFIVDAREEKPWRVAGEAVSIEQHYGVGEWLAVGDNALTHKGRVVAAVSEQQRRHLDEVSDWTTRLRRKNATYILTYKSRLTKDTSLELEWTVSSEMAKRLLENGPFPSVRKTRYVVTRPDGFIWEVDEFEGALAGLVLAEVELQSSDQLVTMPEWIGHEITGLGSWSNRALAETLARESA